MTREEAQQILIHYDDLVWQKDNHITCGMISEALNLATDALNPWHKASEELPQKTDWYFVQVQVMKKRIFEVAMFDLAYGWLCRTDYGSDNVVLYWMEIPEIPKEDKV